MTPEATAYLNEALDIVQQNALKREQVNWREVRRELSDLVKEAKTPADTYGAIEISLQRLNDHHSTFLSPTQVQQRRIGTARRVGLRAVYPSGFVVIVYPESPAAYAGLRVGDQIVLLNGAFPHQMTREAFRYALEAEHLDLVLQPKGQYGTRTVSLQAALYNARRLPQGKRLMQHIGYLDLPELPDSPEHNQLYMAQAQTLLQEIDDPSINRWVLDLRRNVGGNMWPMLVSVGSLLGDGEWCAFSSPSQEVIAFYREGRAGTFTDGELAHFEHPYQLKGAQPVVAVLTSPATASSGEFVTLAFRGCPHSRSFGEPTYGVPTSNYRYELRDGAELVLTVNVGVDRTGHTYDGPISPEHVVKIDWSRLGTEDDPVLEAARAWLQAEVESLEL